jgi:phosphonate ABC transporter substrate-binding protein
MNVTMLMKIVFAAAALLVAAPALAGEKDFIIFTPGMGGGPDQAAAYITAFTGYVEKDRGWPAKSSNGTYIEDAAQARKAIAETKPGFGLIPAWLYLELACGKNAPEPVAAVDGIAGMSDAVRFHVVAKKGTAKTLADLKGKKLISKHVQDHKFVSRVLLGGKVDIDKHFQVKMTFSPSKQFSSLLSGEQDAALVTDEELKGKPKELELTTVFTSEPVAPFPLVAFPNEVKPADRDGVKKTLVGMCASADGKDVCKSLLITRFIPLDAGAYKNAVRQYCSTK